MPFSVSNFRDFGLHFGLQNWHQKAVARILAFSWRSWIALGAFLEALGAFSGCSRAILRRCWALLEGSWGVLGASSGVFESLCEQKAYFFTVVKSQLWNHSCSWAHAAILVKFLFSNLLNWSRCGFAALALCFRCGFAVLYALGACA